MGGLIFYYIMKHALQTERLGVSSIGEKYIYYLEHISLYIHIQHSEIVIHYAFIMFTFILLTHFK